MIEVTLFTRIAQRVTPKKPTGAPLSVVPMSKAARARVHMLASLLLDYPDTAWFAQLDTLVSHLTEVPAEISALFAEFIAQAQEAGQMEWERRYVVTFDLKRKCSMYLSYFATGDTRRRGTALVTFIEAYKAAGWELDANELPDYLPVVLEFSARSDSPVAEALLAAHIEGVEVLRSALESLDSPWARVVRAVTLSLPNVDHATRERVLSLVLEGPPTETVGLSFLGNLPPFTPRGDV